MENIENTESQKTYWSQRYNEERTGWDIGAPSTPLKTYIDQIQDKSIKILIPGAGNSYEAEYLFEMGFSNVYVMDIASEPLEALKKRLPEFPESQIIQANFFEHIGEYALILEQTFFCSFPPTKTNRELYAEKMRNLLEPNGKLVGLWFDIPLKGDMIKRPFGGDKQEYLNYFRPFFNVKVFERCYNSIAPRQGSELFGIFIKS